MSLLPDDLRKVQVPLGLMVGVLSTLAAGWWYIDTNYAHAADLRRAQSQIEERMLTRDKRNLETEIFRLEVKRQQAPAKFDPVDNAVLQRQKEDLLDIKKDIELLKRGEK